MPGIPDPPGGPGPDEPPDESGPGGGPPPGGGGSPYTYVAPGVARRGSGSVYGRRRYPSEMVYSGGAQPLQNQDGPSMSYGGSSYSAGDPYDVYAPSRSYTDVVATGDPGPAPPMTGRHDARWQQRQADYAAARSMYLANQDRAFRTNLQTLLAEQRNGAIRRASISADLYGDDPLTAAYARHAATTGADDAYAGQMAQAYAGWLREGRNMSFQEYMARLHAQYAADQQAEANKFDWGGFAANLGGKALGAYLG